MRRGARPHVHAHDNPQMNLVDDGSGCASDATRWSAACCRRSGRRRRAWLRPSTRPDRIATSAASPISAPTSCASSSTRECSSTPTTCRSRAASRRSTSSKTRTYAGVVSSHSWSSEDAIPRIYALGGLVIPYAGSSAGFVQSWKANKAMAEKVTPPGYTVRLRVGSRHERLRLAGRAPPTRPRPTTSTTRSPARSAT